MTNPMPVFIVEDSYATQVCLQELFDTIGGFRVVGLAGGETDATDWLFKHRTDWKLAIVDLLLAEGSGFGLVHRCRQQHGSGHIVVFSGFASPALKAKCIQMGADAVFQKTELSAFVEHLERLAPHEARS